MVLWGVDISDFAIACDIIKNALLMLEERNIATFVQIALHVHCEDVKL